MQDASQFGLPIVYRQEQVDCCTYDIPEVDQEGQRVTQNESESLRGTFLSLWLVLGVVDEIRDTFQLFLIEIREC